MQFLESIGLLSLGAILGGGQNQASRVVGNAMHAVRTQCARSAKFWMSANTRTLVLAPFHKFLVLYKGFFGFPSI